MQKIPIPKQHGAWGMLYVPYLIALFCFGTIDMRALLALLWITAGFFLQEPLITLIRLYPARKVNTERFSLFFRWTLTYAAMALVILAWLLETVWRPLLFLFMLVAGLFFLIHVLLQSNRADRKVSGEFLSVFSLTMSAPITWYILTGRFDRFGILLWLLNALYFASSIFYVKMRVARFAKRQNTPLVRQSAMYHLAVLSFLLWAVQMNTLPVIVLFAFLPVLLRAIWSIFSAQPKLNLRKIGLAEIGFSLFFLIVLSYGLRS